MGRPRSGRKVLDAGGFGNVLRIEINMGRYAGLGSGSCGMVTDAELATLGSWAGRRSAALMLVDEGDGLHREQEQREQQGLWEAPCHEAHSRTRAIRRRVPPYGSLAGGV